jgi:hypothetical protein
MSRESLPEMVDAYDTRTGRKVRVSASWVGNKLFPHLSKTPKAKAAEAAATSSTNTPKGA